MFELTTPPVVVIGSAIVDTVTQVQDIPRPGETVLALSQTRGAGGKGANQAIAASRAGAETAFISAVGVDPDADLLRLQLASAGVVTAIRDVQGTPTGTASITVAADGENAIVVSLGANLSMTSLTRDEQIMVRDASFVLMQMETPLELLHAVATTVDPRTTSLVLNAAPFQPVPIDILQQVSILIVNESEASRLLNSIEPNRSWPTDLNTDTAQSAASALGRYVPTVIVTLGGAGSCVFDAARKQAHLVPAFTTTVVDTTAAGDTFCGALIACLSMGADLADAARYASAAGALAVGKPGAAASIPDGSAINVFLKNHRTEAVPA